MDEDDEKFESLSYQADQEKVADKVVDKVVNIRAKDECPSVSKQVTETGIGNKKIRIVVETDIRIKNYLSHLAPIRLIRKRFKEKRYIDPLDVEDILNYVIT